MKMKTKDVNQEVPSIMWMKKQHMFIRYMTKSKLLETRNLPATHMPDLLLHPSQISHCQDSERKWNKTMGSHGNLHGFNYASLTAQLTLQHSIPSPTCWQLISSPCFIDEFITWQNVVRKSKDMTYVRLAAEKCWARHSRFSTDFVLTTALETWSISSKSDSSCLCRPLWTVTCFIRR